MTSPKLANGHEDDLELSLMGIAEAKHENLLNHNARRPSTNEMRSHATRASTIRAIFAYPEKSSKPMRPTAWLDGLRGIAALEVVLHHYHLHFLGQQYNQAYGSFVDTKQWWRLPFIRNYYHSAHSMVNVFFVISGFVLTQKSLSFIRTRQYDKLYSSLSSAVFRRFVRIFCPVIAITFFGMILIRLRIKSSEIGFLPVKYYDTIFGQFADWYSSTEKFCNPFHNFEDQWDLIHPYEHVMWTLPIEYFGSLVCYLTVLGVSRVSNTLKRSLIVISIIYLAYRKANWWSANFLAGTLLADYVLSQDKAEKAIASARSNTYAVALQVFWSIMFLWSFYLCGLPDPKPGEYLLPGYEWYISMTPSHFYQHEKGGRFWWTVAGIGLTVSISQLAYLKRICESRFCQYLGKLSFMMYLVHTYLHEIIGKYWSGWLKSLVSTDSYEAIMAANGNYTAPYSGQIMVYCVYWVTIPPILAILSGLATKYIDEPSIKLAKKMEDYFTKDD